MFDENKLDESMSLKSSDQSNVGRSKLLNSDMEIQKMQKFKIPKTEYLFIFFILLFSTAFFGMGSSLFGVSMTEFSRNLNANVKQISYGLTISFILGIFGSLIASYTLDKWNRQLQLAFIFIVMAIIFIAFPWIRSYTLYLFMQAISGLTFTFVGVVPSVWIMEMFGDKSKIYLQIMHLFFPIGQLLGPIAYISIVGDNSKNLWIPYLIVGLLMVLVSVMTIVAYLIKPYENPKKGNDTEPDDQKNDDPVENETTQLSSRYKITFVFMISVVVAIQLANEFNAIAFISTYLQKSDLKLSNADAAYCQGIISTATTVGRGLNVFLTFKIRSHTMLFINFIFMIAGNCVIMVLGNQSVQGVYLGATLLGYGFSNAIPMIYAYVDEQIVLTNKVMSYMNFVAAILMSIDSSVMGQFLDTYPKNYIIVNLSMTAVSTFTFILLAILAMLRTKKRTRKIFDSLFGNNPIVISQANDLSSTSYEAI